MKDAWLDGFETATPKRLKAAMFRTSSRGIAAALNKK